MPLASRVFTPPAIRCLARPLTCSVSFFESSMSRRRALRSIGFAHAWIGFQSAHVHLCQERLFIHAEHGVEPLRRPEPWKDSRQSVSDLPCCGVVFGGIVGRGRVHLQSDQGLVLAQVLRRQWLIAASIRFSIAPVTCFGFGSSGAGPIRTPYFSLRARSPLLHFSRGSTTVSAGAGSPRSGSAASDDLRVVGAAVLGPPARCTERAAVTVVLPAAPSSPSRTRAGKVAANPQAARPGPRGRAACGSFRGGMTS
jgi:hypothetical protein